MEFPQKALIPGELDVASRRFVTCAQFAVFGVQNQDGLLGLKIPIMNPITGLLRE